MKAPTSLFDRPGRATAVVGAVVAVSATAAVALLSGTATATPGAEQPGRCTKNVNVRAEPDIESRIVALCEAGTAVKVGESREGFLRLTDLGGWAAQEYISVNGRAPAAQRASASEDEEEDDDRRGRRATDEARESGASRHGTDATRSGTDRSGADGSDSDRSSAERSGSADEGSADEGSETDEPTDPVETGGYDEYDDSELPGPDQAPRSGGLGSLLG